MKQIVTLGGGTGTFVVLSALRTLPDVSLTAIVSPADNGGSTGHLRDAYGFLPAGDARQSLVALSEDGTMLRELFAYRFGKGNIAGHNLGNLFLTALTDLLGSDAAAIEEASRLLRVRGNVLSASAKPADLVATLPDGTILEGEEAIDERTSDRDRLVSVTYAHPVLLTNEAREAIAHSDVIILGPGDLFTSTAAALLAEGTKEAIAASPAKLIYIVNLFTKAGQTSGMRASDHVAEIERYAGRTPDHIIVNTTPYSDDVLGKYASEGDHPVEDDLGDDSRVVRTAVASELPVTPIAGDPISRSLLRHDSDKLKQTLISLL